MQHIYCDAMRYVFIKTMDLIFNNFHVLEAPWLPSQCLSVLLNGTNKTHLFLIHFTASSIYSLGIFVYGKKNYEEEINTKKNSKYSHNRRSIQM